MIEIIDTARAGCHLATDQPEVAKAWLMALLGQIQPNVFVNFIHKFFPQFLEPAHQIVRACFGTPV